MTKAKPNQKLSRRLRKAGSTALTSARKRAVRVAGSAAAPIAREAAFHPKVRGLAQQVMEGPLAPKVEQLAEQRGLTTHLQRLRSEELPEGHFFAKIIIDDWRKFNGESFRLHQDGKLVYGNRIEAPQRGFPLEYRNIVVTARDESRFSLNLPTTFKIAFSSGQFSTPQQDKYDKTYGVQQHGRVFYSMRGNTKNPKRIIVTFPGFGPSTTRISYAVSYMKQLTDAELQDTLFVAFQDRYSVSGTYMLLDSAGREIRSEIEAVIAGFLSQYGLTDDKMLIFGASKGASTALVYADKFPKARLLVAVPQMNLPYYFSKPFFYDNLYQFDAFHRIAQPVEYLRRYLDEGRSIDYFYTTNDELSNCSTIEYAEGLPNLRKYRFDGVHGAVARDALPTMLGIMRRFLGKGDEQPVAVKSLRTLRDEDGFDRAQVRLEGASMRLPKGGNAYLTADLSGTTLHQSLTPVPRSAIAHHTVAGQALWPLLGESERLSGYDYRLANGSAHRGEVPTATEDRVAAVDHGDAIDASGAVAEYRLLDDRLADRLTYRASLTAGSGAPLAVRLVADLDDAPADIEGANVVDVAVDDATCLVHFFVLRLGVLTRASAVRVEVLASLSEQQREALRGVEWAGAPLELTHS